MSLVRFVDCPSCQERFTISFDANDHVVACPECDAKVAVPACGHAYLAPHHAQAELSREGQAAQAWGREHASFILRVHAHALCIREDRRNELIALADNMLTIFAQNQDDNWLAREIVARSRAVKEIRFLIYAVDHRLKKRFHTPYRARAIITTRLRHRVFQDNSDLTQRE